MGKEFGSAVVTAAAVAFALAGCGGGGSSAATKMVTKTVTVTASAVTSADPTAAEEKSSAPDALVVGKTANLAGNEITVLHVGDKQAARNELIGSDQRFVGVEVKYCLADDSTLSYEPWRILDSDGGEYEAVEVLPSPTDWPHPAYPYDDADGPQRHAGSCVTGWMMFGVNKSAKTAQVVYRGEPGTSEWKAC